MMTRYKAPPTSAVHTRGMRKRGAAAQVRDLAAEYRARAGQYLRELREERGMTQAEVAAELGTVPTTVSAYETGRVPLAADRYEAVSSILHADGVEFPRVMLRCTNPWLYVMLFPRAPDVHEVRAEISGLPVRYLPRGSQGPRKRDYDEPMPWDDVPPIKTSDDAIDELNRALKRKPKQED